jgi:signal transduction histidine kinase
VNNSLLHAFEKKNEGEITFNVFEYCDQIVIKYSDNGVGIPEEDLKKIFDPFFTTKRNQGGIGLGLHILYNIIHQKIKGSIHCESLLGEGTTFTFTITITFPNNINIHSQKKENISVVSQEAITT